MSKNTVVQLRQPEGQDLLSTMLREGAQRLIAEALQAEFDEFLSQFYERRDDQGRAAVVRNGFQPRRELLTGVGSVEVRVPKARSRIEEPAVFRSTLVPPYVRRAKSVDAALPWLYLHGVSTGDMREALAALVGSEAKGLSAPVVARLKGRWSQEYKVWRRKPLGKDRWVYVWADGIYSGLRAEDERLCALVLIGVNERGQKRFLAIEDGVRESKQSWLDLLRDLKARGLKLAPNLAVGDGALGFWAALEELFPTTRQQRCWVHSVPRRAQTRRVKCLSPDRTSKSGSLGQRVAARAVILKHVRHCVASTHAGPANKPAGRSESERESSAVMQLWQQFMGEPVNGSVEPVVQRRRPWGIWKWKRCQVLAPRRLSGGMSGMSVQ
jgi:transposase-like protein